MRQRYQMTEEQWVRLREASSGAVVLGQGNGTRTSQQKANQVWREIADELGFVWDTAQPIAGQPGHTFTAVPKES